MILVLLAIAQSNDERRLEIIRAFERSELRSLLEGARRQRLALVEVRLDALAAISDSRTFTKNSGYALVAERVDAVQRMWTRAAPAVGRLSQDRRRLVAELRGLGIPPDDQFYVWLQLLERRPLTFRELPLEFEETLVTVQVTVRLGKAEAELVETLNNYRVMIGRRPLRVSPELCAAARGHSREMDRTGVFAHGDPRKRATEQGYRGTVVGENIVMGIGSAREAHEAWLRSGPHHRNMLSARWMQIGVGGSGSYWTEMFGE